jgi:hypothetical protein
LHNPKYEQKIQILIQKLWFDIGILSYKQWLDKIGNLKTILNIPPFTLTGDINDAVFPMLNEVSQNSYLLCSLPIHYSIRNESDASPEENSTPTTGHSSKAKRRKTTTDKSKTDSVVSRTSSNSSVNEDKIKTGSIVSRTSSNSTVKNGKKPVTKKRFTSKTSPKMFSPPNSDKLESQVQFREQMQKNENEFQKFCDDNKHLSCMPSKQKIRSHPTAIFGPSPFSDITIQPLKTLRTNNKTELPLKFLWNGVSDAETRSIWKDSSVFFFFETSSSEETEK